MTANFFKLQRGAASVSRSPSPVILPMTISARDSGRREIFVPLANAEEAAVVDGITVYGVRCVRELIEHLSGRERISPVISDAKSLDF